MGSQATIEGVAETPSIMFSIIVPAYNSGLYIGRCLDSVLHQTFGGFECIVVNDGSTDDTLAICSRLASDDTRLVLLDGSNDGVSSARNKGLQAARGEYVLFLDADDWVEPTWLEELSRLCPGQDIVQFDFYEVGTEKKAIHIDSSVDMIVQGEGAVVWRRAYRRELVADLRFDTGIKAGEDYLFSVQAFLRSRSYRHLNSFLYNYNIENPHSIMHSCFAENFGYQLLVTSKVESLLKDRGLYEAHKANLRRRYYWCIREICWRWLTQNIRSGRRRNIAIKLVNHFLKMGWN